jgi:hypothetical protein
MHGSLRFGILADDRYLRQPRHQRQWRDDQEYSRETGFPKRKNERVRNRGSLSEPVDSGRDAGDEDGGQR